MLPIKYENWHIIFAIACKSRTLVLQTFEGVVFSNNLVVHKTFPDTNVYQNFYNLAEELLKGLQWF